MEQRRYSFWEKQVLQGCLPPLYSGTFGKKPSLQTELIKTPWMGLQTGSCHWMGHRKVYNSRSYGVTLLPRAPDRGLTPERRWRRQTMVKVLADVRCGRHRHALWRPA